MTAPQQQKKHIAGPVVITANRLRDGRVAWRDSSGNWVTELARAAIAASSAEAQAMLHASREDSLRVVDPYIAPVAANENGAAAPANLREQIRRGGPTIALPG